MGVMLAIALFMMVSWVPITIPQDGDEDGQGGDDDEHGEAALLVVSTLLHPVVDDADEERSKAVDPHRDRVEEGNLGVGEDALRLEMESQDSPAGEAQGRHEGEDDVEPESLRQRAFFLGLWDDRLERLEVGRFDEGEQEDGN